MFTGGQIINYEKYKEALVSLPAPILGEQLPKVQIDLAGLMAYAREKGVKACDLSEEEKNRFISGGTVESVQESVRATVRYKNLAEWNTANS